MKKRIPAYPLFVNDPFFSIWSKSDKLNESNTIFWNGMVRKTFGFLTVDGMAYSFMGMVKNAIPLKQTNVELNAFSTDYEFECDKFKLIVSFVSPLLPTDLELLSRPVCYMTYKLTPKELLKDVKVCLALHEEHCYNKCDDTVIGGVFDMPYYELAYFGRNRQLPMSNSFDSTAADWGYTYIAAEESFFTNESTLHSLALTGIPTYAYTDADKKALLGVNKYENADSSCEGKFLVAFDEPISIFYYGDWHRGYYFRNGKTIFDAVEEAYLDFDETMAKIKAFSSDLDKRLEKYDYNYSVLCKAALRQTMAGHKLIEDRHGNLLYLSKECHSNGCIATVDITYPAMPLYLIYNPELVNAMIRPVFEFAKMPVWKYDFAPHDCGTYPYVLGQMYGLRCNALENDKYISNSFRRDRWNGIIVTHPYVYTYPSSMDIYKFECQMPIEECGNMLIISYAIMRCGADDSLIKANYELLQKWFKYIKNNGLIPDNQLCTDDFTDRIDANVNLLIKAMVAIKCFSLIAEKYGYQTDSEDALSCLENYKKQFYGLFEKCEHLPLSYKSEGDSYSLKYNMAYDVLFDLGIFSEDMRKREIECYRRVNRYLGLPLDSRSDLVKTDWVLHACTLTDDLDIQKELYAGVANYLNESIDRVPFPDLYRSNIGHLKEVQNRPVQGGIFILLLKDILKK